MKTRRVFQSSFTLMGTLTMTITSHLMRRRLICHRSNRTETDHQLIRRSKKMLWKSVAAVATTTGQRRR